MTSNQQSPAQYRVSITIIGILFFIFGFVTWVNGTLIPYLKIACQLETEVQSFLVVTAFFIAYTVMAIPSSIVLAKTGYKKGMSIGLFIMSVGAALFIPAAQSRDFNMFLAGLFIIGTGLALLQTASNPYVSIIGPIESAASRISIMGISNKFAGIIAGLIFGAITLSDVDGLEKKLKTMDVVTKAAELDALAARVIMPYTIITIVLIILGIAVLFSPLPDINDEGDGLSGSESSDKSSVFQFPHLLLGVLAIFCYVGVEVMAGDTIISYGKSLGIELSTSRYFTSVTLAFMVLGYIIGVFAIPKYLSQQLALKICAVLGAGLTIIAVTSAGVIDLPFIEFLEKSNQQAQFFVINFRPIPISIISIALLGLANSLIWPAIFPLGIEGLGRFTKTGSALLIMGIAGGAILPLVYGKLTELFTNQQAYLLMLPCYLYILFYAIKGHKIGRV